MRLRPWLRLLAASLAAGFKCPEHCLDCIDAVTCSLCEHGFANVGGLCQRAFRVLHKDSCCSSQLSLYTGAWVDVEGCLWLASAREECNPDLVFLTNKDAWLAKQAQYSRGHAETFKFRSSAWTGMSESQPAKAMHGARDSMGGQMMCYCVKQSSTCKPYSCPGQDVVQREAFAPGYRTISAERYCAHRSGALPQRCLVQPPQHSWAENRCEAACNQFAWCVAYSAEIDGDGCSLVSSLGSCPSGSASPGPVAASMLDLAPSDFPGYMCRAKPFSDYSYELLGPGDCQGRLGLVGQSQKRPDVKDAAGCRRECTAWFECEGFSVAADGGCELWTRAARGDGRLGRECYGKRLPGSLTLTTTTLPNTSVVAVTSRAAATTTTTTAAPTAPSAAAPDPPSQGAWYLGAVVAALANAGFCCFLFRRQRLQQPVFQSPPRRGQELDGGYEEFLTDAEVM